MSRVPCVVPFCRRTTKAGNFREWICGKHWRPVSRRLKWLKRTAKRRGRYDIAARTWERCKRQAIERAAGI